MYDRASIPRIFWLIIDKDSLSNVAPLFHDLLYRYGGRLPPNLVSPYREFSREDTDKLFYDLMVKCGVDSGGVLLLTRPLETLLSHTGTGTILAR